MSATTARPTVCLLRRVVASISTFFNNLGCAQPNSCRTDVSAESSGGRSAGGEGVSSTGTGWLTGTTRTTSGLSAAIAEQGATQAHRAWSNGAANGACWYSGQRQ